VLFAWWRGRALNPRPLGYEPYDARLCGPAQSLAGAVTSANRSRGGYRRRGQGYRAGSREGQRRNRSGERGCDPGLLDSQRHGDRLMRRRWARTPASPDRPHTQQLITRGTVGMDWGDLCRIGQGGAPHVAPRPADYETGFGHAGIRPVLRSELGYLLASIRRRPELCDGVAACRPYSLS